MRDQDTLAWARTAQDTIETEMPEMLRFQDGVEQLKTELPTFRLLMEQLGNYHLLPRHLKKEADERLGIKGWALIPVFIEAAT